jgi:hypothetical protein
MVGHLAARQGGDARWTGFRAEIAADCPSRLSIDMSDQRAARCSHPSRVVTWLGGCPEPRAAGATDAAGQAFGLSKTHERPVRSAMKWAVLFVSGATGGPGPSKIPKVPAQGSVVNRQCAPKRPHRTRRGSHENAKSLRVQLSANVHKWVKGRIVRYSTPSVPKVRQ